MVKLRKTKIEQPSSVLGIMRFKEGEALIKLSPQAIIFITLAIVVAVMFLTRIY